MSPLTTTGSCVEDLLGEAVRRFPTSPTPRLDAQVLLCHAMNRPRSWILAHPEAVPDADQSIRFEEYVRRRSAQEPVAYIRGWTEWYGRRFHVTPATLIPRPETELLLQIGLDVVDRVRANRVVDVGTGCGAIAISLALERSQIDVEAVDISPNALEVARRNAAAHGATAVDFVQGDLLEPITGPPDVIVANLPYLSDAMMNEIPGPVTFEPVMALAGAGDGLDLYRALLEQAAERGWTPAVVAEIDARQARTARDLFEASLGRVEVDIIDDLAGLPRIVRAAPAARLSA